MKRILTLAFIFALTAIPALAQPGDHTTGAYGNHTPAGRQADIDRSRNILGQIHDAEATPAGQRPAEKAKLDGVADKMTRQINHDLAACPSCH